MAVFSASSFPVTIPPTKVYCLVRLIQPHLTSRQRQRPLCGTPRANLFGYAIFCSVACRSHKGDKSPSFPLSQSGMNGDFVKLYAEAENSRIRRA